MRYLAHNEVWLLAHGEPPGRDPPRPAGTTTCCRSGRSGARSTAGASRRHRAARKDFFDGPTGSGEHLRWEVTPWRTAAGSIGGIIIYAERITEQVETERRLAERESMIRDLFEQSPVGLNLCSMQGLWFESNPAFLDIIGYTQDEADGGLTYWQLTPRKYDATRRSSSRTSACTGATARTRRSSSARMVRLVPVRLNGFLVEREGVDYIWSLIEDLTAQRALEARVEEERIKAIHARSSR